MPEISYQLYCSRNFPPLGDTLQMLSSAGYDQVEGYGALMDDANHLKDVLDAYGLQMTSSHISLDLLENDPTKAVSIAKKLGLKKAFGPFVGPEGRPSDTAGWKAFGKRLVELGKPLQDAGIVFGWHNHAFEFDATPEGDIPMDLIVDADDSLMLELDLGWVRVAGHDPVDWIAKYAGRITTVHVKDIAPDGHAADEDGWADVGHGVMDWSDIHAALQTAGVSHYVVEHDNPNDHERFAVRSMATLKTL